MNSIPRKGQILGIIILGMFFCVGFYRYYSLRVSPANVLEFEITEQTPLEPPQEQEKTQFIKVHIVGAVEKPGVYSLEEGKRIDDVVKLAIPTKEADLSLINLASLLEDGRQYYVPKKGEEQIIPISNESSVGEKVRAKVNINRASLSELQTLNGIGPALAQRIIDYRREQGPFNSIEEITEVKGIGSVLLEKIRDNITV